MNLQSYPYQSAADLEAMIQLMSALRNSGQVVSLSAADLREELDDPGVQLSTRLWKKGHRLAGFAYIDRYQNIITVFHQPEFSETVQAEVMDWLEAANHRRSQARGEPLSLDASAMEDDLPRIAFLERFGFVKQTSTSLLLSRPLTIPIPEPRIPPGFHIRPMGGMAEIEAYAALHRAAFGSETMTAAYRRSIMSTPTYLPDLDLVAVTPSGELAAFCMCQIFAGDPPRAGGIKEGWTDPIGTHPAYRGRGLARALILAGLRLLRERGVDTALMGTSSDNQAMQRLAQQTGFHVFTTTRWYSKVAG